MSKTLVQLQADAKEMMSNENVHYSAVNTVLNLADKVGDVARYARKVRNFNKKGIGKHDPVEGKQKVMVSMGQLLINAAAFAEHNEFTLDEAREAAAAEVTAKRS